MAETFKYRAFISYSHRDKRWGDWLHKALETYRVPRRLVGAEGRDGPILPRLFPIFRDREELPTSDDLPTQITNALTQSAYLIVICSPNGATSRWVGEEILAFKRMGRENRILAIVVGGEPNASDSPVSGQVAPATECFPEALRFRLGPDGQLSSVRAEPIAADARDHGDGRENAKLKLIAGLLGVGFDALKRRDLEAQRRRARVYQAIAVAMGALALAATSAGWFAYQKAVEADARRLEANAQRQRAEASAAEAIRQRTLAQSAAIEANRQKALAQQSAIQANAERKRAEQEAVEANQQRLAANTQRNLAEQAATRAQIGQSRLLAFVANEQLDSGHAELASLLSLQALPRDFANPDRPVVPEATAALERSVRANRASGLLMQADNAISVAFDPGGMHIAVGDNKGDLAIYEIATGERTYFAHLLGDVMTGLAWSPRGDRIAVSGDKSPKLIAYPSMAVVATLNGHVRDVPQVRFSPDGRTLATASWDNSVKVWDAETGALMTTMTPPAPAASATSDQAEDDPIVRAVTDTTQKIFGSVSRLSYSPDGARIATSGTVDREAVSRLWDVASGRELAKLSVPHANWGVDNEDVNFSPDGTRIAASNGGGGDVYLWDSGDHRLVATLMGHSAQVNAIKFSPDGSLLATASLDKTVRVWDGHTGALLHILMGHASRINDIAFSPDGTRLVSVSEDGTMRIWNPVNGAAVDVIQAHDFTISHATFSPYGTLIASVSQDATLRLWSAKRDEPLSAVPPAPVGNMFDNGPDGVGWVSSLAAGAASDNGLFLGLEVLNGRIETYDTETLRRKGLSLDELGQVWFMRFEGFGHRVVAANGQRLVELDMPSGKIVRQLDIGLEPPPPALLQHLAGAPAPGAFVTSTEAEDQARDAVQATRAKAIVAGQDRFDVSANGDVVLLPRDNTYEVWNFLTRRDVGTITAPLARIAADGRTIWSLDGRRFELRSAADLSLISSGEAEAVRSGPGAVATIAGGQVTVLDAATGDRRMTLAGTQANFSPAGDRLAVLDRAGIAIEDLAQKRQIARFATPAPALDRLSLSSDGQRLLAVAPGQAWLLDAASGRLVATLATAAPPPDEESPLIIDPTRPWAGASGRLPAFSADGRAVVYVDDKSRAVTISADDGSPRAVVDPGQNGDTTELPSLVAISADASHLFLGTKDGTSAYDAHTGALLGLLPQDANANDNALIGSGLSQMRFLPDGSLALCEQCDVYNAELGLRLPGHAASTTGDVELTDTDCPQKMKTSEDGRWALCKRNDNSVFLIDVHTHHVQAEFGANTLEPDDADFSPDGKWLGYREPQADADLPTKYAIRNIETGAVAFEQQVWNPEKIVFSPGGQWVAVGTSFGAIDIRHIGDWTSKTVRLGLIGATNPTFSPDGRLMMVGAGNGVVAVVDTADGSLLFKRKVHDGAVSALTFSHDSSLALTAGEDGAIHLWDTAAWVDIGQFRLADAPDTISDLRFSPDDSKIVAYSNSRAYVWTLLAPGWSHRPSLPDLADYARSVATRELTDDERRTYFLPAVTAETATGSGATFGVRGGQAASTAPEIARCDQAASDPYDADRLAPAPAATPAAADIEACRLGLERAARDRPGDLARMKYLYGRALSFAQDTQAQTLDLITQAAEAGYPAARRVLSDIYATGSLGVKADPAAQLKWLQLAAQGGDPLAVKALGVWRFNTARTDEEAREGLRLQTLAADAGLPEANLELARFALGISPRYAALDLKQALYRMFVCADGYAELGDSAAALRCRGRALQIEAKLGAEDAVAAWRMARDFRPTPIAAQPTLIASADPDRRPLAGAIKP